MKRTALEYMRDILGALEKTREFTQGIGVRADVCRYVASYVP